MSLSRRAFALVQAPTVFLLAVSSSAQSLKLNGPLARELGGGVFETQISPDGQWVVYSATERSQVRGLFSVRVDGSGSSIQLLQPASGPTVIWPDNLVVNGGFALPIDGSRPPLPILPALEGHVSNLRFTPDRTRAVYLLSTGSNNGPYRLYSASLRAAADPVQLSASGSCSIGWYELSSDGERALYLCGEELFSVVVDGSSSPVRLAGMVPFPGALPIRDHIRISADGAHAVYMSDRNTDVIELYSAPLDGSAGPVKLSGTLVTGGDVQNFELSPDGARVVYLADQELNGREELYSVPVDRSAAPVKLNGPMANNASDVTLFEISPDGRWVVFKSNQDGLPGRELRRAPIAGNAPALALSGPNPLDSFTFVPDGTRVVYRASPAGFVDLYSVPVARGPAVKLTATAGAGGPALYPGFQITPRGESVVYLEELGPGANGTVWEFRGVRVDGSAEPVRLGASFELPYGGPDFQISPDGQYLVVRVERDARDVFEIFSVPLDGHREFVRLNGPLITDHEVGDVRSFELAADGSGGVFTVRSVENWNSFDELYGFHLQSGDPPVKLFPSYTPSDGVGVGRARIHSGRVVFTYGGGEESGYSLYSAPLDGHLAPTLLNDPTTSQEGVGRFLLSPDGGTVVFNAYQNDTNGGSELYAVASGGGPEIELSGELVAGGYVLEFQVTAGGERVVFAADRFVNETYELFSVPLDGSSEPIRLSAALVPGGDVDWTWFEVAPDGHTVVYRADQTVDELFELYAVPSDGSSGPVRLSGPLVAGGDVQPGFRISPDGSRVVFCADQSADELFELYSVAIDGTSAPLTLNAALVAGGDVQPEFEIGPAGTWVAYLADQEVDERFELFGAALDGSTGPVKLSATLIADGDVRPGFRSSPDGRRLLYRADQNHDERIELFSALAPGAGGGASVVMLNDLLAANGDVLDTLRFSPDGSQVLFVADQRADELFELFSAPIERPKGARRISDALVAGGDVTTRPTAPDEIRPLFESTPDGRGAVYIADQDTDDVFELYFTLLARTSGGALPGARAAR